ncbi:MAG: hypothetical protein QM516_00445 [Limnohabitans sp.]|nr:hypothetical protein [Limnohabitans sp.]
MRSATRGCTLCVLIAVGMTLFAPFSELHAQGVVISDSHGKTRTVTREEFRSMKVLRYEIWCYGDRNTVGWTYTGPTADAAKRELDSARRTEQEGRRVAGNTPPTEWTRALNRTKGPIAIVDGTAIREQQQRAKEQQQNRIEEQRRRDAEQKAAAEKRAAAESRRQEAEQNQQRIRNELERKRNEAERLRRDAEAARREREEAAERTRDMQAALDRAESIMNAGNTFADAFSKINDILQEKIERDAARDAEREAQRQADLAEERAEQAAREERELEERLRDRQILDDVRDDMYDDPPPVVIDPNIGLPVKPGDGYDPPPVFPVDPPVTPSSPASRSYPTPARSGFDYDALAGAGGRDSSDGAMDESSGGLLSGVLSAFGGDDDSSPRAGRGSLATGDDPQFDSSTANASSNSALRRLFGGQGGANGATGAASDAGDASDAGQSQGDSALRKLGQRFGIGGGAAASRSADSQPDSRGVKQDLWNKIPESWRDNFLIWMVTNQYENERNTRVFGPERAKQMDRRGLVNTGYELYIESSGDEIPLEAREAYYRHRILLGWLTRDPSGTANAYKDYVENAITDQLPDASKKEDDK